MERLHCFPQPFPDELLYSLAVRYHRLSANHSYRRTSQDLFGVYSRTCGSILPCCLGTLSKELAWAYSVHELINNFTLFPLYEPFLSEAKRSAARIAMAGDSGTGLKMSLGLTASGFLKHASFRYCESCVTEDRRNCGSAYWHRIHQAMGSCVCPLHGKALRAITFPNGADWRCMLLPGEAVGSQIMETPAASAVDIVSEMQFWALNHPTDMQRLLAGNFLGHRLEEMGFLKSGRIREQALRAFLNSTLLLNPLANEFQEICHSCDWVFTVLRPRQRVIQPLKFYFLCWLLKADLEQLRAFDAQAHTCNKEARKGDDPGATFDHAEVQARRAAFSSSLSMKCHEKPGYMWLYRHDRGWLAEYVSAHPFTRSRPELVDWDARDLALARELLIARDQILSTQEKPQKINRAALGRKVARSREFLKIPNKFPISTFLMTDMLESNHDYQIRKINWAVRRYLLPEQSSVSVVYRCAGIRVPHVTVEEVLHILSHV
ncbi:MULTISPECIES: TnsD family Tn7-like transposition protein [unclassified Pseudomonas]|uniref:TnsD family Tn7-like transposition protein n=1 Tax=unclassified Pseudomonas TaxID=196821 RepID=UPI0030D77471